MANEQQQREGDASPFPPLLLRPERARLIVLEGIDLSGRTTQVQLLRDWLTAQRYYVTTTAWRTSPLIADVLARARTKSPLHPLSYSLLYCADHLDRTERVIKPALAHGGIVLADRYTYTAFARDEARGLDREWVRNLYRFTIEPDVVFYLHISPDEAVRRRIALQQQREQLQDAQPKKQRGKEQKKRRQSPAPLVSLTAEGMESFHEFEMKMYEKYQSMQKEFDFAVVEGSQSVDRVQAMLRRAVMRLLLEP
ncbi:MAG: dTMP kinase [Ktedonobacteraceae bacterium]|nr:dTMP kinase [Ktedonobacteraceae bacterium]